MGDMGDLFNAMKAATKQHRAQKLAEADTTGWTKHTEYHFSKIVNGERIDWWPSGGKAKFKGKMIYSHRKVNALLERIKNEPAK